jgi:type II secretory pathway pseudopilin PulG
MLKQLRSQAGDTLIEVLFAFSVLSLVIVGALTIMNQGSIASQRALETTLVRDEVDSQATAIRFLHDAYTAQFKPNATYDPATAAGQWALMSQSLSATAASSFGTAATCPTPPSGSFIIDPTHAQWIWVEAIRSPISADVNKKNTRYIDFHIYACWDGPGQGLPMTIGTIVRLYEPQS